jgi:glycosyltransferase involved in cell wall biosynthesis
MAAGVPPVVTRVGAMAEVVAEGRAGLVVPPGDPAALASALECLRGDEAGRAALGRAAAQRVREVYGARRMAREYEAVYSRLLGRALD